MTMHFPRHLRIGLLAAAVFAAGCQSLPSTVAPTANAPLLRHDAFTGIYEVAPTADGQSVFVADITGFDPKNGGFVHRLDPRTLQIQQTVQLPRRSFALGLNARTGTLYAGNTMEGSMSVIDARSGAVQATIQMAQPRKNDKGEEVYPHTRKVIVDEKHNRIFATSPGRPGLIWIVDGKTRTLTHTITSDGIWTAGGAYDAQRNRLYVGQGGVDEILAIDPDAGQVVGRFSTGETKDNQDSKHFFINLALDAQGQRLFAVDPNTNRVYVADIASGRFVREVPLNGVGLLDIVYSPQRRELVVSHRGVNRSTPEGTGGVTVLDADSFAVKRQLDLPVHPNSLALSPDGQTLYVTVKAPHGDKHPAYRKDARDSLVRIDLRAG